MGIFKDIGTFVTKTIPKVVTKDIPKAVTKGIPQLITKEIPKVVTKDIPRLVTKDIPNVITKEIPELVTKDIPNLVTKEIPKAVTQGIPNLVTRDIPNLITKGVPQAFEDVSDYLSEDIEYITNPETYQPGIGALRKRVDTMEQRIATNRATFIELRARYTQERSAYMSVSEDYTAKYGQKAAEVRIGYVYDRAWNDPGVFDSKALLALDSSFRFVVGFVSFGAADAAWVASESKKEMDFLEKRESELAAVLMRFSNLNKKLNEAIDYYRTQIHVLRKELGQDQEVVHEALNDQRMEQAGQVAIEEVASNMLKSGEPVALVSIVTGLSIDRLKQMTQELGTELEVKATDHEQAARELIADGLPNTHIQRLTDIDVETLDRLRSEHEQCNQSPAA